MFCGVFELYVYVLCLRIGYSCIWFYRCYDYVFCRRYEDSRSGYITSCLDWFHFYVRFFYFLWLCLDDVCGSQILFLGCHFWVGLSVIILCCYFIVWCDEGWWDFFDCSHFGWCGRLGYLRSCIWFWCLGFV